MKILVKKMNDLVLPNKAHPDDAAYDVVAVSEPNIVGIKFERPLDGVYAWSKIDYIEFRTNLYVEPLGEIIDGKVVKYHIEGLGRSSISKKNLILANCEATIDNPYRGEIRFRFKYIFQPEDYIILPEAGRTNLYAILNPDNIYKKGDKIAQIKPSPNIKMDFVLTEELNNTTRGSGGFGSTGK